MRPALPSISHLIVPEWWAQARQMIGDRRLNEPSVIQKRRAERKRIEKITPVLVRQYLSGALRSDLHRQHKITIKMCTEIIEKNTTPEEIKEVEAERHRRQVRRWCKRDRANRREMVMAGFSTSERERFAQVVGRPVRVPAHAPDPVWQMQTRNK